MSEGRFFGLHSEYLLVVLEEVRVACVDLGVAEDILNGDLLVSLRPGSSGLGSGGVLL